MTRLLLALVVLMLAAPAAQAGRDISYGIVIGNPGIVVGDARDYIERRFPEAWSLLPTDAG